MELNSDGSILFLARHKTATNFSQHSANYKALQTQPKLAQEKLPVACSSSETLSMENCKGKLADHPHK